MNQRIKEIEERIISLTRRIETLTNSKSFVEAEIQACITEVNELKTELEFEKQNQEAEDTWNRDNIYEEN